jgi:hypothetical protein
LPSPPGGAILPAVETMKAHDHPPSPSGPCHGDDRERDARTHAESAHSRRLNRRRPALAALSGAALGLLGAFASAQAAPPPPAPAKGDVATTPTLLDQLTASFGETFSAEALQLGWKILLALGMFLLGWILAKLLSFVVFRLLTRTNLDNQLAEKLGLEALMKERSGKQPRDPNALERGISSVVFWLLMLLVVVAVLEFAGLSQAAAPIQRLVDTVVQAIPLLVKASLLLLVAWIAGLVLRGAVVKALELTRIDARLAELAPPPEVAETAGKDGKDGAAGDEAASPTKPGPDEAPSFAQTVGQVVFWLCLVVGLAGAFDALQITPLADPMRNAIDTAVSALPEIGVAAVIVFAGWILGRILRAVVTNLTKAAGLDGLADRLGIAALFGEAGASGVLGILAMLFVMVQAVVAALDRIGMQTLSRPLTDVVAKFWALLPALAVAIVLVAAGVVVARLARRFVAEALRRAGFDTFMARLGLGTLAEREDKLGEPAELVGFIVQAGIVLVAVAQALAHLELHTWAGYVDAFLTFLVQRAAVALLVVAVGFAVGNWVRDAVRARRGTAADAPEWVAELARWTVLVFAFTMAVAQLGVAEDFVLLAFGLTFGALCLAVALAFGLGSREVAAKIVEQRWAAMRATSGGPGGPGAASASTTTRPASPAAPAGLGFGGAPATSTTPLGVTPPAAPLLPPTSPKSEG